MPVKAQTHHFQASKNRFGLEMVAGEIAREPLTMGTVMCIK
jgi:hypothetical protein